MQYVFYPISVLVFSPISIVESTIRLHPVTKRRVQAYCELRGKGKGILLGRKYCIKFCKLFTLLVTAAQGQNWAFTFKSNEINSCHRTKAKIQYWVSDKNFLIPWNHLAGWGRVKYVWGCSPQDAPKSTLNYSLMYHVSLIKRCSRLKAAPNEHCAINTAQKYGRNRRSIRMSFL